MHAVAFRKATEIFIEEVDIGGMKHLRGLVIDLISFSIDSVQKKNVKTNISVSLGGFFNLFFCDYLIFHLKFIIATFCRAFSQGHSQFSSSFIMSLWH